MELWPLTFCDACQFQSVHSTGHTHIGAQDINVLFRARREVPYLPPGCLDLPHDPRSPRRRAGRPPWPYLAGSFGLPATKLPLPSGLPATKLPLPSGLPATKLPEPSGLPATKLPEPCGPVFAVPHAVWAKPGAAAKSPAARSANFKVFIVEISMSRPTGHPWMQFILNCRSKRYVRWRTSGRNVGWSNGRLGVFSESASNCVGSSFDFRFLYVSGRTPTI